MPFARPAFAFPVAFASVEPDLITVGNIPQGFTYTTRVRDGSATALVARLSDNAPEPLVSAVAALNHGISIFAEQANAERSQVHPARFPDRVRELVAKHVSPAYQGVVKAGTAARREEDAKWKRNTTPEPGTGTIGQEYRQLWQSLSFAERAARIERADYDELGAVIEGGGLFPDMIDTQIWDAIERRFASLNIAKIYGANGQFSRQPTPDEPLATGPDPAQVEAFAQKFVDAHKQRMNDLELVETSLQSVITAIAAATELQVPASFDLLMGRGK